MTVRDLIEANDPRAIEVIIRENGCGQWIYAYKIGERVQVGKYDYISATMKQNVRGFYIPANKVEVCRHDRHCKCLIIPGPVKKKCPKEVLELEVSTFRFGVVVDDIIRSDHDALAITCYPKGWTMPEPAAEKKQPVDENQMTLF